MSMKSMVTGNCHSCMIPVLKRLRFTVVCRVSNGIHNGSPKLHGLALDSRLAVRHALLMISPPLLKYTLLQGLMIGRKLQGNVGQTINGVRR